ncbi:hypothetical protein AAFF_G00422490 [Aldrovandia affinis]|uniref:G-protein coupled receptors family 1 profile domain-containing protein n=1 Tax=Aldrovandia affinis TaxID=143900 RepID=A0AAD7T6D0_9TELE|nr:hypothetical protein AAFF_G00422490 [Aldrovandia affinis]
MNQSNYVHENAYDYDYDYSPTNNTIYGTISLQMDTVSALRVILPVVNIIIFLLGVCGNGIVIWISGVMMKKSVNTTWYLSLAFSDFVFCVCLPFTIASMATSDWPFGLFMCKFTSFVKMLSMFSSIFLLVLISVDRCVSVVFPVWSQNHRTVKAASALVTSAWGISVVLSVPSAILRKIKTHNGKAICLINYGAGYINQTVGLSRFVCGFVIPFLIITICYSIIVVKLKSNRMTKSSKPFKVMSALIATFFVCWFPYHVFILLEFNNKKHHPDILKTGLMVSSALASANRSLNPFLYAFIQKDFKKMCRGSFLSKIEHALGDDTHTTSKGHTLVKCPIDF